MHSTMELQSALRAHGFQPGPIDGVFGRGTRDAIVAFQRARGLVPDGVAGRLTLEALGLTGLAQGPEPAPPWFAEAGRKMGLHEVKHKSVLTAWLRSDGATLGDPSKLPWCGDFVETCLALTLPQERMIANPYYALNWLKFGAPLKVPAVGAIAVFSRPGGGHVGFVVKDGGDRLLIRGGNQSNAVKDVPISKARLEGYRWPLTYPAPGAALVAGKVAGKLSVNEA